MFMGRARLGSPMSASWLCFPGAMGGRVASGKCRPPFPNSYRFTLCSEKLFRLPSQPRVTSNNFFYWASQVK